MVIVQSPVATAILVDALARAAARVDRLEADGSCARAALGAARRTHERLTAELRGRGEL